MKGYYNVPSQIRTLRPVFWIGESRPLDRRLPPGFPGLCLVSIGDVLVCSRRVCSCACVRRACVLKASVLVCLFVISKNQNVTRSH